MPAIPGMLNGGTILFSPATLPAGDSFLLVSSTGTISSVALATYQAASEKGQADGYASLDSGGKIPASELPAIAITEYLGEAANQAAMLLLDGEKGDWTVRTDTGTVWIITGSDPTQLADWTELSYPTAPVQSVAGKTGVVTLATGDIASGTFDDARIAESNVTQHEAALTITTGQITGLDSYLLATEIASGTITPRADDIDLSGGSDGDVLTVQADGSLALEAPSGGASSPLTLTANTISETPLTLNGTAGQTAPLLVLNGVQSNAPASQIQFSGATATTGIRLRINAGASTHMAFCANGTDLCSMWGSRLHFTFGKVISWGSHLSGAVGAIILGESGAITFAPGNNTTTAAAAKVDNNATAGNTRLLVWDVDTGALQRVKVGANNSGPGGSGRALYIDNS